MNGFIVFHIKESMWYCSHSSCDMHNSDNTNSIILCNQMPSVSLNEHTKVLCNRGVSLVGIRIGLALITG